MPFSRASSATSGSRPPPDRAPARARRRCNTASSRWSEHARRRVEWPDRFYNHHSAQRLARRPYRKPASRMIRTAPIERRIARRAAIALLLGAALAHADPLEDILAAGAASAEAGRTAQAAAERADDDTHALAAEYAVLRR